MLAQLLLLADQAPAQPPDGGGGPAWGPFLPMIAILVLFYFLIILPMRRKEKQERENLNKNLKRNDTVVTHAGIIGVVSHIDPQDDEVTLRLEEGKMKILKTSIARILKASEGG